LSLLWEHRAAGQLYQVRQAGRSVRLYTNGVFHSQYNPGRPVSGNVWDLLWLPAFFYPAGRVRRILVLGVGGGAVIPQLRRFAAPDLVVGVELDPVHLLVARRFFGVDDSGVELHCADAVTWIRQYRGAPFDMIIDDLFGEYDGEPQRAVYPGEEWVNCLAGHLSVDGMIVTNCATRLELEASAYLNGGSRSHGFRSLFALHTPQNYNAVGAALRIDTDTRALRERLKRQPLLDPRRARGLKYRINSLPLC